MQIFFLIFLFGVIAVTILDGLGAIASRRLSFSYGRLALFSFIIYGAIGYIGAGMIDTMAGITLTGLVALFDAIVGFRICIALGANWGELQEMVEENFGEDPLETSEVLMSVIIGMVVGGIGTLFV
ncbi:MAG: hypothetical protein ACI85O_001151 [Saprospiraceae bacterium]|jgi:hypothetical protein